MCLHAILAAQLRQFVPVRLAGFRIELYRNSDNALSIDRVPIEDLGQVKLTGTAGGASDVVAFTSTDGIAYALSEDSFLSLNLSWQQAEFNVVGNCCYTQAGFNIGSTLVVRTSITDGTAQAPSCVTNGTTGETNNLTLFGPCTSSGGTSPAIVFTERFLGAAAAQQPISIVDYHNQQHFTYTAASGENGMRIPARIAKMRPGTCRKSERRRCDDRSGGRARTNGQHLRIGRSGPHRVPGWRRRKIRDASIARTAAADNGSCRRSTSAG